MPFLPAASLKLAHKYCVSFLKSKNVKAVFVVVLDMPASHVTFSNKGKTKRVHFS